MPRFTFKKTERLCSLKAIDELYQRGTSFFSTNFKLIYSLPAEPQAAPCQVVFSVPKKNFKRAVDRNLVKRRMRESYRMHKGLLYAHLAEKQKNMHLLIIYTAKEIHDFDALDEGLLKALKTLTQKTG